MPWLYQGIPVIVEPYDRANGIVKITYDTGVTQLISYRGPTDFDWVTQDTFDRLYQSYGGPIMNTEE